MIDKKEIEIILITLSNHYDHQSMMYELHAELKKNNRNLVTIGLQNPKYSGELGSHNFLVKAPKNPGISFGTFNLIGLIKIFFLIKKANSKKVLFLSSHMWNIFLIILLRIFRFKNKVNIYHSIHDFIPHEGDVNEKNVNKYNKFVTKFSDNIVLYNAGIVSRFCNDYRIDSSKIIVLNYWRKFYNYKEYKRTNTCIFFGRINYYKGVQHFDRIIHNLPDINFIIAGQPDKNGRAYLDHLAKYNNVKIIERYIFGEESKDLIGNSELLILPYNSATMSGVVIEAYMNSRPVIAFSVGGINEQISNANSGILVEPGEIDKFIKQIELYFNLSNLEKKNYCHRAYNYGFKKYDVVANSTLFIARILEESS